MVGEWSGMGWVGLAWTGEGWPGMARIGYGGVLRGFVSHCFSKKFLNVCRSGN